MTLSATGRMAGAAQRLRRAAAVAMAMAMAVAVALLLVGLAAPGPVAAQDSRTASPAGWEAVEKAARGQKVYFNAWGGEPRINAYIDWAARQVAEIHGVTVEHVKLGATAEAVARILAEAEGGNTTDGSVDLIWINGENFAALAQRGLLHAGWTALLPSMAYVDAAATPSVASDFGIPVDGREAPWGLAQLVFLHDARRLPVPPRSPARLLQWAAENPGRFTYPQPPHFMGTTFLRQLLLDLAPQKEALHLPVGQTDPAAVTKPLWDYLDRLHPLLWRAGRAFPANTGAARTLFSDGEIELTISFDPAEAANGIASGVLPPDTAVYTFDSGTIGNASFLAIPANSPNKEGAMVLANFLLSPGAQLRKQDPAVWGNMTVLSMARLDAAERAAFAALARAPGMPEPGSLAPALEEPHPSWTPYLDEQWQRRYASGR